jgi:hypothetical protein
MPRDERSLPIACRDDGGKREGTEEKWFSPLFILKEC